MTTTPSPRSISASRPVFIGDALLPFVEKQWLKVDKEHKFQRFVGDNGKATANIVCHGRQPELSPAAAAWFTWIWDKAPAWRPDSSARSITSRENSRKDNQYQSTTVTEQL